jgi:hypothetical protein
MYSKSDVNVFEEWCQCIRRVMSMYQWRMSIYHYSKFKRFDELLIEKTKCIKEHTKMSKNLYSECYFVVAHILNRISSSILNWDSSLIFMQKLLKELIQNEIIHFKIFDCKTFSLLKKTDAFKKNEKMKSRTFIEYLIIYDFINNFELKIQRKTT